MSKIDEIRDFIKEKKEHFGAKTDAEFKMPYVPRNNTTAKRLRKALGCSWDKLLGS